MKLKDLGDQVDIYYFSGTGNTLLAVNAVASRLQEEDFRVNTIPLEKTDPAGINTDHILGLAFPVAIQGTYPFIWDFVSRLPRTDGTPVFMFTTKLIHSGGIKGPVKKILKKKGYLPLGAAEFNMPSNVFIKKGMTPNKRAKIEKGLRRARSYAEKLIAGRARWLDIPLYSDIMSVFSRSKKLWSVYRALTPIGVDKDSCTGCQICTHTCPVGNIEMSKENKPVFKDRCVFCLRCYSFCPEEAIFYHRYRGARYRAVSVEDLMNEK